ncbi:MAG: fimbria/pilus periplasmic chaperone, partial [Acidobacteria bacterium]|nr:fimbria/pilus periplasmic chaperone [Acidobacteriota bacterium]
MPKALRAVSRMLVGLAVICQADVVFGSSFTVNPTIIELSSRTTSALLTVRNESNETLRFQLSVFAWNQKPNGEMDLAPTEDIVFFPTLFSIGPKQERRVRIGAATPVGPIEKSYRIFVEELPSAQAAPGAAASEVKVLTRMGVPIFLRPATPKSSVDLSGVGLKSGLLEFDLRNLGNVRVIPRAAKVTGFGPGGDRLFASDLQSWYVLSNGVRHYSVDLSGGQCRDVRRLEVEFAFDSVTLRERLETPSGVC